MTRCLKRRIIHAEMLLLICLKSRGYTIVLSILRCHLQTQYPTRLLLPLKVASQHLAQSSPGTNYQGAGLLTIDLTILF